MGDGFSEVLAHFGIVGARVVRERGAYICSTASGRFKLAKSADSTEVITRTHALKEHLAHADFPYTDRFVMGANGLPFTQIGADCFVLTIAPEGHPVDFTSPGEIVSAAQTLARFHIAARGFSIPYPIAPSHTEIFARGAETLSAAKKQIRKQKQRSDFDIALMKNAPAYEARIAAAQEILAASPYETLYETALAQKHICHNLIKEDHIKLTDGLANHKEVHLSYFSNASINIQLHDLALLLQRASAHTPESPLYTPVLDAYNKISPLPNGAEAVLQAFLHYPGALIKIVENYRAKKRTWTPAAFMKRLEEEIMGVKGA